MLSAIRNRPYLLPIAGLTLLFFVLLPARFATLRGDDIWTFQLHGLLELKGDSFVGFVVDSLGQTVDEGRPQFLGGIQGLLTILVFEGHPVAYRVYLVLLTVVAAALLYRLVTLFGAPPGVGVLVLTLLGGAIQFRPYHDAMLGYYGVTQWVLILLLGSLIAFLAWLRGGRRRGLMLALGLYVPILLMYESAYTLCAAHLALALLERRGRFALRAALPFVAVSAVFVGVAYIARRQATDVAPGYEVSLSIGRAIRAYAVQLFPPLPGSTQLFEPLGGFYPLGGAPTKAELLGAIWRGAAVVSVVLWLALWVRRRGAGAMPSPGVAGRMVAVGAMLWLSPVILLAPAPKYQAELTPGKGYLPTLIQEFGWALVAAGALIAIGRLALRRSSAAVVFAGIVASACLGFAAAVSGFSNLRVAALETPASEARQLLERAATHGLFREVPVRATLLFSSKDTRWPTGSWTFGPASVESMLLWRGGRLFDGRIEADVTKLGCTGKEFHQLSYPPPDCEAISPDAAWVRFRGHRGGGNVILGTLEKPHTHSARRDVTRDLRVFSENDGGRTPPPPRLVGQSVAARPWRSDRLPWRKEAAGAGWAIYRARVTGPAPIAALIDDSAGALDFTALGPPEQIVRIYGTRRLLP